METRLWKKCNLLDELTNGLDADIITTLYGPSGSGKSNICLILTAEIAKTKKVIYIDTEGGFSLERIKQINFEYEKIIDNIILLKPMNFEEQIKSMRVLQNMIDEKVGIVIIDTISMLYRLEFGNQEEIYELNRALGRQLGLLTEIARKNNIPVLLTNQVYANFENPGQVNMVGGDLLKYSSKCLIELRKLQSGIRNAVVRKHRSLPEGREINFKIINEGIQIIKTLDDINNENNEKRETQDEFNDFMVKRSE